MVYKSRKVWRIYDEAYDVYKLDYLFGDNLPNPHLKHPHGKRPHPRRTIMGVGVDYRNGNEEGRT